MQQSIGDLKQIPPGCRGRDTTREVRTRSSVEDARREGALPRDGWLVAAPLTRHSLHFLWLSMVIQRSHPAQLDNGEASPLSRNPTVLCLCRIPFPSSMRRSKMIVSLRFPTRVPGDSRRHRRTRSSRGRRCGLRSPRRREQSRTIR